MTLLQKIAAWFDRYLVDPYDYYQNLMRTKQQVRWRGATGALMIENYAQSIVPPALLTPSRGTVAGTVNPTLTWVGLSGAIEYDVQVSLMSNFTPVTTSEITTTGTNVSWAPALDAQTFYYWRVRAVYSSATSEWSEAETFITTT